MFYIHAHYNRLTSLSTFFHPSEVSTKSRGFTTDSPLEQDSGGGGGMSKSSCTRSRSEHDACLEDLNLAAKSFGLSRLNSETQPDRKKGKKSLQ